MMPTIKTERTKLVLILCNLVGFIFCIILLSSSWMICNECILIADIKSIQDLPLAQQNDLIVNSFMMFGILWSLVVLNIWLNPRPTNNSNKKNDW